MTKARHTRVAPASARRYPRRLSALVVLAGVAAVGALAGPVAGAEQQHDQASTSPLTSLRADVDALDGAGLPTRAASTRVSRDQPRRDAVRASDDAPVPVVAGPQAVPGSTPGFAREDTTIVADPSAPATVLDDLERGAEVALTGRTDRGFAEIVRNGALAWVPLDHVGDAPPPKETAPPTQKAPPPPSVTPSAAPAPVSGSSCPGGGSIESGLRSNTIKTYRAVCAAFPGLTYGGVRPGDPGEHGTGRALDIMVGRATGDRVAAFLQENAAELGVDNVIWRQRIWFAGDPSSQWQSMEDRGSATANHMDHVHVGTR